jgi:hypothetical protein
MSDGNTCLFCKSTFSVPFGLEPTELCNMCAQELSARVLDACVTSWVPTQGKTPKELLHALLMADQRVALDPAVSEAAKALQDAERDKIVAWLRARTAKHPFVMLSVIAELAGGAHKEK